MTSNHHYASFWARLIAFFIDQFLFWLLFSLWFYNLALSPNLSILFNNLFLFFITTFFPILLFGTLFQSILILYFGGTLGQIITGLKIIGENNKPLTFNMILFRQFIGGLFSSSLFGLGYLSILKDQKRQAWHDKAVGSYVVINKPFLILGIILLVLILGLNFFLLSSTVKNFNQNVLLKNDLIHFIVDLSQSLPNQKGAESRTTNSEDTNLLSQNIEQQISDQNYEQAVFLAQTGIGQDPNNPIFYNQLARALAGLGEMDKATQAASKAVELDPQNPDLQQDLNIIQSNSNPK